MYDQPQADRLEQVDAMRQGVDYRFDIKCRGYSVTVRPLSMMETVMVASNVNSELLKLPEHVRTNVMSNTLMAKETLKLATKPDVDSKQEPLLTDVIMDRMTPEELQFIHRQYVQAIDRANPVMEEIPKEEVIALAEAIKKNVSAVTELSFLQAVNVCRYLIQGD